MLVVSRDRRRSRSDPRTRSTVRNRALDAGSAGTLEPKGSVVAVALRKRRSGSETRRRTKLIALRVTPKQAEAWRRAALSEEMALSSWIRRELNRAAVAQGVSVDVQHAERSS